MTPTPPAVIRGDAVVLRPWAASDLGYLREAYADPQIARWSPFALLPEDVGYVLQRRLHPGADEPPAWVVAEQSDGPAVGDVSFRWVYPWLRTAAIGYVLLPHARGRGLATAAVRAVSAHVSGVLGWPRLELHHAVSNAASCAVARRAGFALEGTMRQALRYADGQWYDEHLHARLAGDED